MVDVAGLASLAAWAYLLVFGLSALDAVFPVLPSESVVIVAAALATNGDLDPLALFGVAAAGALTGDLCSFGLGRLARRRWRDPEELGGRRQQLLAWARRHLDHRGEQVIITARFVPGGRTATTFSAGYLGLRRRRFVRAAVLGAVLWAANGVALGYIGGQVSENPFVAMAGGLTLGALASLAIHLVQRRRRGGPLPGGGEDEDAAAEHDVAVVVDVVGEGGGDGVDGGGADVVVEPVEGEAGGADLGGGRGRRPGVEAAAEREGEPVGCGRRPRPPGRLEQPRRPGGVAQ
ncbi:MAG TPA: DedA family protein [Iamia sp.]|nr:DedA family protein [Iamia sp.]